MSERIITLFGEEIVPEQPKPVARTRAKKKGDDKKEDEEAEKNTASETTDMPVVEEINAATPPDSVIEEPVAEAVISPDQIVAATEVVAESVVDESATVPDAAINTEETEAVATEPENTTEEPASISSVGETNGSPEINQSAATESEISDVSISASVPESEQEDTTTAELEPTGEELENTDETPEQEATLKKEHINLPDDWKGEKHYYSIGEVAELFKVKTSHIRFWTNEFKLKVRTTRKGDRLYTPDQIKELRAIHHLVKERGFTLNGAKSKLASGNNLVVETVDLKKSLMQLRNQLMAIKNQLK